MAENPQLNSLDRFRKQPGRLVLEEHSHCEVPAGCGGVVLRWRDPYASVPVAFHLYTPGTIAAFLDGNEISAMRFDLAPGRHSVSLQLDEFAPTTALVMFAVRPFPEPHEKTGEPGKGIPTPTEVSRGDGSWRYTTRTPPEGWQRVDFDDGGWAPLIEVPTPVLAQDAAGWYQVRNLNESGAACLGTRTPVGGPVWVRHVFEVSSPDTPG